MTRPYRSHRAAALAILESGTHLTRKSGCFLGQIIADPTQLSAAQEIWLAQLLGRAKLPPLRMRAGRSS